MAQQIGRRDALYGLEEVNCNDWEVLWRGLWGRGSGGLYKLSAPHLTARKKTGASILPPQGSELCKRQYELESEAKLQKAPQPTDDTCLHPAETPGRGPGKLGPDS